MTTSRRRFLAAAAGGLAAAPALAADAAIQFPNRTKFAATAEMWWSRLPFLKRLEAAAALGFTAVEFWPWRGKDINAVAETCKRLNLTVAQFTGWGFRPGLNEPA